MPTGAALVTTTRRMPVACVARTTPPARGGDAGVGRRPRAEAGQDRVGALDGDLSTEDLDPALQVGRDHAGPGASGVLAHRPCHRG